MGGARYAQKLDHFTRWCKFVRIHEKLEIQVMITFAHWQQHNSLCSVIWLSTIMNMFSSRVKVGSTWKLSTNRLKIETWKVEVRIYMAIEFHVRIRQTTFRRATRDIKVEFACFTSIISCYQGTSRTTDHLYEWPSQRIRDVLKLILSLIGALVSFVRRSELDTLAVCR